MFETASTPRILALEQSKNTSHTSPCFVLHRVVSAVRTWIQTSWDDFRSKEMQQRLKTLCDAVDRYVEYTTVAAESSRCLRDLWLCLAVKYCPNSHYLVM